MAKMEDFKCLGLFSTRVGMWLERSVAILFWSVYTQTTPAECIQAGQDAFIQCEEIPDPKQTRGANHPPNSLLRDLWKKVIRKVASKIYGFVFPDPMNRMEMRQDDCKSTTGVTDV